MRILDSFLELDKTNKTTHWFLLQTAKQNKWGQMHLLPKVRQLNVKEIAQAEMHPHKSLN